MDPTDELLFGPDAASWLPPLRQLVPALRGYSYHFLPEEIFQSTLFKSIPSGMEIYWREMLYRAHHAAATSLLRFERWTAGVVEAYRAANLFGFAACLRGVIESAADTFDALDVVPTTLADAHVLIKRALKGKLNEITLNGDLEQRLIHFSHARRLEKGESAPSSHKAKQVTEYLKNFNSDKNSEIRDCYGTLCQISHPSFLSLAPFLEMSSDGSRVTISVTPSDRSTIEELMGLHRSAMLPVFVLAMLPAILTLRVLNKFPLATTHTSAVEKLDLSRNEAWLRIASRLKDQRSPTVRYLDGISSEELRDMGLA